MITIGALIEVNPAGSSYKGIRLAGKTGRVVSIDDTGQRGIVALVRIGGRLEPEMQLEDLHPIEG
jgi:hypothetical protein